MSPASKLFVYVTNASTCSPGENAVGRGDKNDIILDDQSVSDNHAVITVLPGGASILVKDLDSTNKTRYQATEDASWEVIKVRKLSHHVWLHIHSFYAL